MTKEYRWITNGTIQKMIKNNESLPEGFNYGRLSMPEEQKKKDRESHIGKKHSDITKLKISLQLRGCNNPFFGKHHSKEIKKIISEKGKGRTSANKGKHIYNNGLEEKIFSDDEFIPKEYVKGRLSFSQETLLKMSQSASGENNSMFGKKFDAEVIKKRTEKILKTKEENNSFNTSESSEGVFEKFLIDIGLKYKKQYKEERYPFYCDFYIPEYDLFIELNHFVTHGKHPFNSSNQEDLDELERLNKRFKETKSNLYKAMIECWTIRDVNKMQIAIKNNLNYKVSYNEKEMQIIMNEIRSIFNKENFE